MIAVLLASGWMTARAALYDDDYKTGYLNGSVWYHNSWVYLDSGGGGWVISGGSGTSKTSGSALDYIEVRSRGREYCAGVPTDTNWDQSAWGSGIIYNVVGSGFSSAGNCGWYVWFPCKVFTSEGNHRTDDYGPPYAYQTANTNAGVIEPLGC
jgi:hypothetical protein